MCNCEGCQPSDGDVLIGGKQDSTYFYRNQLSNRDRPTYPEESLDRCQYGRKGEWDRSCLATSLEHPAIERAWPSCATSMQTGFGNGIMSRSDIILHHQRDHSHCFIYPCGCEWSICCRNCLRFFKDCSHQSPDASIMRCRFEYFCIYSRFHVLMCGGVWNKHKCGGIWNKHKKSNPWRFVGGHGFILWSEKSQVIYSWSAFSYYLDFHWACTVLGICCVGRGW